MTINVRSKGASGEREFIKWMINHDFIYDGVPERNLEQVRNGGTDIIYPPFGFEVKRCQSLNFINWWIQVKTDCEDHKLDLMPIVAFRQNSKKWEFLISAKNIGLELGYVHINETTFINWSQKYINLL